MGLEYLNLGASGTDIDYLAVVCWKKRLSATRLFDLSPGKKE